jgi:hypothetical protein
MLPHRSDRLGVQAAYEVMTDDRGKVGIAHAGVAMAALPHRRTTAPVWEREGGQIKLLVESGLDSAKQPIGLNASIRFRAAAAIAQVEGNSHVTINRRPISSLGCTASKCR